MRISRRNLLRQIGLGAVASTGIVSLAPVSRGAGKGAWQAEDGGRHSGAIRLDRNENAYGPSDKVVSAVKETALKVNRYPEQEAEQLRTKIASLHNVRPEEVVLGCGSSEIMRMTVSAFAGAGKQLIVAQPTYGLIAHFAQGAGIEVISVPLDKKYSHDLNAMLAHANAATALVYICNPNNPTGSLTPRLDIEAFVQSLPPTTYVLIDEAYHHFVGQSADYTSFIDRRLDDQRVIVLRSFSNTLGMAGLRIGYAIATPQTARRINAYHLPEQVNIVAARAAMAALDDTEYRMAIVKRNADDRQEFLNQANARMVRTIDSQTNFVMVNAARPADEVIEHFRKNKISLPQVFHPFDEYIRVSLGTPSEMCEFWRVWDLMGMHKMSM